MIASARGTQRDPAVQRRPPVVDAILVHSLIDSLSPGDSGERDNRQGTVVYAGAGPSDDGMIAWQMSRSWSELVVVDPTTVAACSAALASSVRIQIICELASGSVTTGELTQRLDQPSPGQLYHHLKELRSSRRGGTAEWWPGHHRA